MKKTVVALIAAMIVLLGVFSVYGKDNSVPVQQVPDATVEELLQEVDILLYRTVPVKESQEKALVLLDRIIKLDPRCKQAYTYKANTLINLGRGNEGVAVFDAAIKAMPGDYQLHYMKGDCLMQLKRYKEAVAAYDKALKSKDPEFLKASTDYILGYKAEALYQLKQYKEAIEIYDRLITGSGYYYSFEHGMKKGMALMELKKYNDAAKWFGEFKKHIVPQDSEQLGKAYYYSACAYSMMGNVSKAVSELESAIKLDKSNKTTARTDKYFSKISKNKDFLDVLDFEENLLKSLGLGEGFFLIDKQVYDINGDKANDKAALVGHKSGKEWVNTDNIVLVIIDGKSGRQTVITPEYTEGTVYTDYQHYLLPYDLDGDGILDMAIELGAKGGSTYCAYSFKDNSPVMLFSSDSISKGISFTVKRLDANTAEVRSNVWDKPLTVDLTVAERDKSRLDESGQVGGLNRIEFVDVDGDKVYELKGYRGVEGFGGIYGFGSVISTHKYDRTKAEWVLTDLQYKWGR